MTRLHRASAFTALVGLLASCGGNKSSGSGGDRGGSAVDPAYVQEASAPDGLELRVSEGKQGPPAYDRAKLAPAKPLPAADAQALLARAAPIAKAATDQQAFALRPASQPPPRTGQTITAAFPPPPSLQKPPAASDAGKDLRVLRWMPEGQVPLVPELSVTFSQPMIAVTSQTDAARAVPVKLTPQPPGKWRWIGTRTIVFDPDVRFPQATTYQVEVPAGTKGTAGAALAAATKFSFETPPPTLVSSFPSGGHQRLDAPIFVLFDQKIDAQAVLGKLRVTANGKPWGATLLDPAALDTLAKSRRTDHRQVAALVTAAKQNGQNGRWLALRPAQPLPTDAAIEVVIPEGTPSAEGPNRTKQAQWLSFRTYPPLRIRSESEGDQAPGQPYGIRFTNTLDAAKLDRKQVTVQPDIPGLRVIPSGDGIVLWGAAKARTRYKVTLSREITDEFGQKLGRDEEVTWLVGDAAPSFFGPSGVVVLDPAAKRPALDFFSTNYSGLKVRLYKVAPSDFDAYRVYLREQWNRDRPPKLPGALVVDRLVQTGGGPNQLTETAIELEPALGQSGPGAGLGHAIAVVEPHPWKESHEPPRMIAWVQSTRLAVDAHVDAGELIAFATELGSGKPAGGVALELRPSGARAETDAQGTATIPLGGQSARGAHYLIARRGDDVAFIDDGGYWNESGAWTARTRPVQLAWYVVDDRKLYKPGEQVSLKGWLRTINPNEQGDLGGTLGQVASVSFTAYDAQNNQLATGTAPVNAAGGFDAKIVLPKTPNLGHARIDFVAAGAAAWEGREHQHVIQIEEFRRPEFEVTAQASQGPFLVGGGGDVTVSAKYYAGGPLPGAPVAWSVTASRTSYTPPNRDDYTFGEWEPWWGYHGFAAAATDDLDEATLPYGHVGRAPATWSLAGKTDATGAHTMHLDFLSVKPAVPMSVAASASVVDVNRQAWSASSALIVHPSELYVGLKTKKLFVEKGTPLELDVIGVDLDGKAAPGAKIDVKAVRLDWEYEGGKYRTREVDPQACPVTAGKEPARCTLATRAGGTYQVTATIVDAKGRPNQTKLTLWVTGGDQPRAREVEQEQVQIIPDRKTYAAGTTAELLVQAPFYPAEGLVTWRRSGIVKMERITLDGPTKVIGVPITEAMVPNLHVQVDLVGAAARLDDKGAADPKLPKRPAYAVGTIDLAVPPKQRTLAVEVSPSVPKLAPGESAELAVSVTDAAGRPVAGAEAAVIVVDEAILALTGASFVSPVDVFYGMRAADATDHYLRGYVKLAKPDAGRLQAQKGLALPVGGNMATSPAEFAPGASAGSGAPMADPAPAPTSPAAQAPPAEEAEQPNRKVPEGVLGKRQADGKEAGGPAIAIRSNFNPLAAFAPAVKTDAAGRATVRVKVPDNLTRYRIVAIAAAGEQQFGKGESALVARLPLMVRPSPPRFLNFGDTFRLPVVVQNQTDAPMTVRLAARTTNLALTDGAGREVTVPANDRVEVQFPAAAELAGTARLQIVGQSIGGAGKASDAAEVALPVWTPMTTEAFATYGVIDDNGAVRQPVALPGKVVTQFGGLEITTASTNLQALTDAVLYLVRYPYECAEQRASRMLAIAGLRDVLSAFRTQALPSAAAMELSVAADVERLAQLQNGDGGFPFWERGYPSVPYLTVHVANALARAKQKGFAVSPLPIENVKTYLRGIEVYYEPAYPKEVQWAISAYALYVRKLLGDVDIAKGQKLLADAGGVEKVSLETSGWLLGLFAGDKAAQAERAAIVRHALNRVSETAGAASFTTSYKDGAHLLLASDHRVDAVLLESLIQEQPDLDLIPKLVTGLLGHRKAGQWLNTQENSFALLALDRYFDTYEKATPDFVARVWLGNDYAGERAFRGRTTDYFAIPIPMRDVAAHDQQDLTIQKDGRGRLYYRIGMTYAPASLALPPADYGFVVERRYEGVDSPGDVVRQPDGVWKIKAGARVRVRLSMVNESRRYHVALVDPLPAGLEPMNPSLAVTGPIPQDPNVQRQKGAYWWWYGPWYEHQNLRDERVEAFASLLWEGVHTYEYVARATTPGTFVVPPPKAEEMYMPETFG
ncbi:MAG TPA: DUF6049 family protein, partial [Kofleriaceae bacterium]|nr:DUF6049 family protein [Kofleriaceae bacterium]